MSKAKTKMNILVVHNRYQIPGGEDTVVANETQMLQQYGHRVILYTRSNSELNRMTRMGKLLLPITTVFSLKTYRDVRNLVKAEHIDLIHVHNTLSLISPSVYYAARSCRVPVVQTVHNFRLLCPGAAFYRDGHVCEDCMEHGLLCAVKHRCYRGSWLQTLACVISTSLHRLTGIYGKLHYICLTEFNRKKLLCLKQICPEQVFVKPNFVDVPQNEEPANPEDQFIFAGRLDALKGVDLLLEAWKQLGKTAPRLLLCGTGPMGDWCRQYIRDNRLNAVEMTGFLPNEQVREQIGKSKALILPTRWYEGFPMTIAEAFSVGTPVIVPDMGNAGALVEEGITGVKYAQATPEQIAEAVRRFDSSPELRQHVRSTFVEKYARDINYEKLMEIYQTAIEREADRSARR